MNSPTEPEPQSKVAAKAKEFLQEFESLNKMLAALPDNLSKELLDQSGKVADIYADMMGIYSKLMHERFADLSLAIKAVEFDLQATRREKKDLEDQLNDDDD